MIKKNLLLMAAAGCMLTASAGEIQFSYSPFDAKIYSYGFGKTETYDVAILLKDPALVGAKVKALSVMATTDAVTDVTGWLTTELKLKSSKNDPDIAQAEAVIENGFISVEFDEPYTITENGVYVGYSLKVNSIETDALKYPLTVSAAKNPNGFFVHTSRTYRKWTSLSETKGLSSALSVTLDGDFSSNAAGCVLSDAFGVKGENAVVTLTVTNKGTNSISSVGYSYTLSPSGLTGRGEAVLDNPIPAQFGMSTGVPVSINCPDTYETQTVDLTLTHVNGESNTATDATSKASIRLYDFIPETYPLMEEYTGMWCGWCPRGFIALEEMGRRYPERFIGLSYHNGDVLEITETYPNSVSGFPVAYLNRKISCDPYYGTGQNDMGIESDWSSLASVFAPADVKVSLEWKDESRNVLKAVSTVRFVEDGSDLDYRLSYVVVEDGMKCPSPEELPSWLQSNNYSGSTMYGEGWDVFCNGGSKVAGLVFNDIVVYAGDYAGEAGSVPETVEKAVSYTHEYSVPLESIVNTSGSNLVQDADKLRVVAILTDAKTGAFINCNRSNYVNESGVKAVSNPDAYILETRYYDLTGRRVLTPTEDRMLIRTDIMSDGTIRSVKIR